LAFSSWQRGHFASAIWKFLSAFALAGGQDLLINFNVLLLKDGLKRVSLCSPSVFSGSSVVKISCKSTGGRAKKAAEKVANEGFSQAVVVEGGTLAWNDAGLPVERGATKVISLERQVRIAAGSLVVLGVALGYFVHPWFIGLSAFVGAGLVFAGITDFCGMGLLLAKQMIPTLEGQAIQNVSSLTNYESSRYV